MSPKVELAFAKFVGSMWFRLIARTAAIAGLAVASTVSGYIFWLSSRVDTIEQSRAVRIVQTDATFEQIERDLSGVHQALDPIAADTAAVRDDTQLMKGILQQMNERVSPAVSLIPSRNGGG